MNIATANGLTRGQESATLIKIAEQMGIENIQQAIESFLRGNMKITVIKHTVDLGAPPRLPFEGDEVVKHVGTGIAEIELRSDDKLYIGGKKVVLHLSERQMGNNRVVGYELRNELEGGEQVLLNGNLLDYLYEHPELLPEHWKKDESGETRFIFFWGSIFCNPSHGELYVRGLFWRDGGLDRGCYCLGNDWFRQDPSASVAS